MDRSTTGSPQKEFISPEQALSQKWVIGRGWVDAETLRLEEEEEAIREATKGDCEYQRWADEQ